MQIGIITNPNEHDNVFYMHGNNIDFPYNYIEYRIDHSKISELKNGNTADIVTK